MMKQYQMDGINSLCTQQRGQRITHPTTTPAPAKVAPFKQHTSSLQRECAELGVCQGFTPPCGLCAEHADTPASTGRYSIDAFVFWGAVVLLSAFSAAVLAGVVGWASVALF